MEPSAALAPAPSLPAPLVDVDLAGSDAALMEALGAFGAGEHEAEVRAFGRWAGSAATLADGHLANALPPELGPDGEVVFDASWHRVLGGAVEAGVAGGAWRDERDGAQVARAARFIAVAQAEAGVTCPIAMTNASVPALRLDAAAAAAWEPLATSTTYDVRPLPGAQKDGGLVGMALTEVQGGSDLRGCTTTARQDGDAWVVDGAKHFVSAVQSDAFFVLAQTPDGLGCVLVPRRREDGTSNGLKATRLKDKLGNRSNPTAEVVLEGAVGRMVGEPGRGVRTIMAMIAGTRLDCVLGSTAVLRTGVAEAVRWAQERQAFGRPLAAQPAMAAVLADLALEAEAATWAALRLARAAEDHHRGDAGATLLRRLALPAVKFWVCKRAPHHAAEALECVGGLGYTEDSRLARSYREAPLMSVWEGSGTIQALDVLRALHREPEARDAVLGEIELAAGADAHLDRAVAALREDLGGAPDEAAARDLARRLALAFQASLLVRHAPPFVADAFCASRLGGLDGGAHGTLPAGTDVAAVVERAAA